jgi:hypothetical protein
MVEKLIFLLLSVFLVIHVIIIHMRFLEFYYEAQDTTSDSFNIKQIKEGQCSINVQNIILRYLQVLSKLKTNIIKSKNADIYLSYYNNNTCEICNEKNNICKSNKILINPEKAYYRLLTFQNGIFGEIIKRLEKTGLEILIAGSSGIASVLKKTEEFKGFEPKDMDIYIKRISGKKIKCLDLAIRQIFANDNIILIRRPLTLTWWIYDKFDNYKTRIQLNMLYLRSWAEVFVVYHSDMVCVGYDIRRKKYIVLTERWNRFIESYPYVWITNFNSNEKCDGLKKLSKKYCDRGFKCDVISVIRDSMLKTNNENTVSDDDNDDDLKDNNNGLSILNKLIKAYRLCPDIIVSDTIDHLHNDRDIPKYINLGSLDNENYYVKQIIDFEYPDGKECPVLIQKYNIAAANKNCKHEISLKAYILMKEIKKCPMCRANFEPYIHNTIINKPKTKHTKDIDIITDHKFIYKSVVLGTNEVVQSVNKCKLYKFNIDDIPKYKKCDCQECIVYNNNNCNITNNNDMSDDLPPLEEDDEDEDDRTPQVNNEQISELSEEEELINPAPLEVNNSINDEDEDLRVWERQNWTNMSRDI